MGHGGRPLAAWVPAFLTVGASGAAICIPVYALIELAEKRRTSVWLWSCVAIVLVAAGAQSLADILILSNLGPVPPERQPPFMDSLRFNAMLYVWIYALYATAAFLVLALARADEGRRQLLLAHAAADRARLDALRLQVSPHFLFNSLNAAISLLGFQRNAEAEKVLVCLSDFLRSSLQTTAGDTICLSDEFEVLEAYLEIEKVRFGSRMLVTLDLPEALKSVQIPHFLLQPLVENAIKHGAAKTVGPWTLTIAAEVVDGGYRVRVLNDAPPTIAVTSEPGVGLGNVKERLEVLFGKAAGLTIFETPGAFEARVDIPIPADGN